MTVSPAKSQAILKCKGIGAEQLRRRFVRQTPTGPVLRIRTASFCVEIPLVHSFIYLGAAVSYDHFEDRALTHRLGIGKKNFGRLTKILRGRNALARIHKLCIWQACVYTATVYGLDTCGITPIGAKKAQAYQIDSPRPCLCHQPNAPGCPRTVGTTGPHRSHQAPNAPGTG